MCKMHPKLENLYFFFILDLRPMSCTVIIKNNSLELFDRNQMLMWKSPFANNRNRTIQASMKTAKMRCLFATTSKDES